ncbi:MAG: hypothetical protein ACREOG_06305 [Gemmatimonadaceae bacterium]
MTSRTTARFRAALAALPEPIRLRAKRAYELFRENPQHPGLRFKQVHSTRPIFSVRIGSGYRALAVREGDDLVWFWIGTHDDYEALLTRL